MKEMMRPFKGWKIGKRLAVLALLALTASCATITEDLPLCTSQLAFRYDYNMKYADAFPVAVRKLDVFVFDAADRLVTTFSEEREAFGTDFHLPLDLPEGRYHLVAWAGRYDRSYVFQQELVPGVSTPADLQVRVRRDVGEVRHTELDDLWHGELWADLSPLRNERLTLALTKDTNRFRIVVQGPPGWDGEGLQFSITDTNGWLGGDNAVLPDAPLEYRPYVQHLAEIDGEVNVGPDTPSSEGPLRAAVAELSTSRLLEESPSRLRIAYPDGSRLLSVDLIPYLLLTKMEGHAMEAQEYLDRQDEYALVFFLSKDTSGKYVVMKITVNGWTVRPQTGDF